MKITYAKDDNKKVLKEIKAEDVKKMTLKELADLVLTLIKAIAK